MKPPKRMEVLEMFRALISGELSRDDASDIARPWIIERDNEVDDLVVFAGLECLLRADLKTSPTTYLYGSEDFADWLVEFEPQLSQPNAAES